MPPPSQYTVQAGDNIFTISRRMNVSFTELAEANNLSSPRDVRVGQVLVSPSGQL
jgi:LysM repeat protein